MLHSASWAAVLITSLWLVTRLTVAQSDCLLSGDQEPINKLLLEGGAGATISLCRGSAHHLTAPIVFTAEHQTIETQGHPLDHLRAELIVTGNEQAVAIKGDCPKCSWITVRSLIVDGNRPNLLRVKGGQALIMLGNAEGQVVRDCRLFEPRGWTAIHLREGDRKQCSRAHIHDNVIGPNGEEWDEDYDDRRHKGWRKSVRYGSPVADGISLACKDSVVENNTIFDCTDGLVVVFGSPGSEIRYNTLYSKTRLVQGAVNLVDIPPWDGDYTGTWVHHNTINAHSRFMRTAIAVGRSTWDDEVNEAIYGGKITDNTLGGPHFGYGIVASTCKDFTITGNVVGSDAVFSGMSSPRCPTNPPNSPPKAFLFNKGSVEASTLQEEFVNGEVQFIICIDMLTPDGVPAPARRFRDSPLAIAQREEEDRRNNPEKYRTNDQGVDIHVAEALVSYQMNLVSAMQGLHSRVPSGDASARDGPSPPREVFEGISSIEDGRGLLHHNMLDAASDVNKLKSKLHEQELKQKSRIAALQTALSVTPSAEEHENVHTSGDGNGVSSQAVVLFAGASVAVAVLFLIRRYRSRKSHAALKMY